MASAEEKHKAHRLLWLNILNTSKKSNKKSKRELLKSIPLFDSLTDRQLKFLINILHERNYEENECIFEINQPGAALFIIEEGEVSIELPHKSETTELARMIKGSFFGEIALLDQSPRSASARAVRPTRALALFRKELNGLINSEPEIASKIFQSLSILISERLKATNKLV